MLKHVAMNCRVNYRVKSAVVWRNAVTRVKEEISVNIDGIDPWNLKFLSESTETCGGMEAVHYSCDTVIFSQLLKLTWPDISAIYVYEGSFLSLLINLVRMV